LIGFEPSTIEGILLDIDGTIANTDDAAVAKAERWLRVIRRFLPEQDSHRAARRFVMRIETPVNAIIAWLDRTGLDQVLGPIIDSLYRLRGIADRTHAALIPGVENTLNHLADHYRLGVVTAREYTSAHAILEAHALDPLFQCVATARTCRRAKPHPDPVLWAVKQLGVTPSRCLMVGDTTADIIAGNAAGLVTVGVLCGFGDQAELEQAGADIVLADTADLAHLLLASRS
jgi:HAD superfamily hydrolase (TIGR01509 family)